ncbi:uncharacterized protein LOC120628740 isoform X2 [Pararge aegeria]|uniref:uncharacterized protein LOC120628740 isoform X2 n=1 Tax=Pararge aegeria TaxID=116150 RepID=UPI0019D194B8|nr:uncharacterized protein LOC120628740 isoform X2 [Pararge aegeria]XP_039753270.1 uncharacterized protein LOC120628740 isoform X2 [Pararge aegeria]XP_039753271.1 uncharacterized protein LOC120628740 isoform X2 [Pararge aegeria]
MNDPWDVKSVRQSNQYLSCMKINGVPLLPPVLSKECRKEMQYYRLLAKEVEKRIQTLKPLISESDTESSEDKTDAPDLPESEHSYEISQNDVQDGFNVHVDKTKTVTTEKCLDDCEISRVQPTSNTFDNITSNLSTDTDSSSSKLSSKLMIDLSLSINETGKNLLDSPNSSNALPNDLPERDCDCSKVDPKVLICSENNNRFDDTIKDEKVNFSFTITKNTFVDPKTHFNHDGPSSISSKSFTGSLNDIHMESLKETQAAPLVRQRSYTVLKPSPMLLAHLEVQSMNTGIEVTSISMSESLSNISTANKKRRSWDLESAKEKWSSMALELKKKNITNHAKSLNYAAKNQISSNPVRKIQSSPPRAKSVTQDRQRRNPVKTVNKSDPIQKTKNAASPMRNSHNTQNTVKAPPQIVGNKNETECKKQKLISESEDPATRVRELYDKIQKQQLIQMANLVEKQKKEQMLLQHVFEEQNNMLFTQLKTICPKSPNEVKEAWADKNNGISDRGPVSLSQVINHKPQQPCDSPVHSTLTETNNYLNYCDNVLKKSRNITGSNKKHTTKNNYDHEKNNSPNHPSDGSRTRTHSPARRNTLTSRKLTYENSASSDRECEPILTDRTNDTMADLNVTFPSDKSEECQPFIYNSCHNNMRDTIMESPLSAPVAAASFKSTDRAIRSMEETIQNSINSMCVRNAKKCVIRPTTAHEQAAASKIVAYAKGYLVRRLMNTERVQATVQTIKDALMCALQLHQDREGIRGADVDLHRRLIQQITAACYSLHDTFVASSAAERCALIAADRSRKRLLAARLSPAPITPNRLYRPTDLMSQSHTGAFPTRVKRHAPSLMTQSNYETFSGDKTVRRYMPSPRRRPWR